jgi:hypothetical protein
MDPNAPGSNTGLLGYSPNKEKRRARRRIYERYYYMRGDGLRSDAENDWEMADAMFAQDIPAPDTDDWRAHLVLPDAFSGIQAQMQETIDRNSRPYLRRVEDSDEGIEEFQNSILTYNLNRTNFDYQYFLAKYTAAIRGTAYLFEYYRVDKRDIMDPQSVNADGTLKYVKKEVTDYDDAYTEWIPNELIYIDPNAKHIDEAVDMIRRDIMDVDEFKRRYAFNKDFFDLDFVHRGGQTTVQSFFKMPHDMNENQVEILHYYNRAEDLYYVAANNILIRMGPIPFKHKELPVTPIYHYIIPGRMYGMGIPHIINALTQERASIRNLNLDRQKMHIQKMYLVNDQVDFDDEDLTVRPHGFVEVGTNGLAIKDAIMPLEYGDVPGSYFRSEEILLEDIRRATGIDDRISGAQSSGTATAASFQQESSQKRINLIAKLAEMDAIKRIGKLKWANIQFFYPAPRIERITEENDEREKKVYKKITADGQEFSITKDPETGKTALKVNEVEGTTTFKLDPSHARYMEGDYDVVVDIESVTVVSKPLKQAKITELMNLVSANPILMQQVDARKALTRLYEINDEQPKNWLSGNGTSDEEQMEQAEWENSVMRQGVVLSPTDGATTLHTMQHINYTQSAEYQALVDTIKEIFQRHILGEHEANPGTGSAADAMEGAGLQPPGPPNMGPPPPGGPTPPNQLPTPTPGGGGPQIQPADLQPSTVTGQVPNSATSNAPLLRRGGQ